MAELSEAEIQDWAIRIIDQPERPRRRPRLRVAAPLRDVAGHDVPTAVGLVSAWRSGLGPAVLLVHGSRDDHSLWTPLIDKLLAQGRAVLAVDLPGHGHSQADNAGVLENAAAILEVVRVLGPVDAYVGHSLGVMVGVRSLSKGLEVQSAVMIAGPLPSRPELARKRFFEIKPDVPAPVVSRITELLAERNRHAAADRFDPEVAVAKFQARALFLHCQDDELWLPEASHALASRWPGAIVEVTHGLGHRAIARDGGVVARVADFLAGPGV
jgi:pimeloyl-ACP methyl ester carboxylesterase